MRIKTRKFQWVPVKKEGNITNIQEVVKREDGTYIVGVDLTVNPNKIIASVDNDLQTKGEIVKNFSRYLQEEYFMVGSLDFLLAFTKKQLLHTIDIIKKFIEEDIKTTELNVNIGGCKYTLGIVQEKDLFIMFTIQNYNNRIKNKNL